MPHKASEPPELKNKILLSGAKAISSVKSFKWPQLQYTYCSSPVQFLESHHFIALLLKNTYEVSGNHSVERFFFLNVNPEIQLKYNGGSGLQFWNSF